MGNFNQRASQSSSGPADLRGLLRRAAFALGRPGAGTWGRLRCATAALGAGGTALVVDDRVCEVLLVRWEGGWQPAEVVRAVRRGLGPEHADLMRTAIAASRGGEGAGTGWGRGPSAGATLSLTPSGSPSRRRDQVDDDTAKLFPRLGRASASSVSNPDGWWAGRAAAEMAPLGPERRPLEGMHG